MNRIFLFLPILFALLGFTTKSVADDNTDNPLAVLNTSAEHAKSAILHAITGPSFFIPNSKALKNLSEKDRIAFVQLAGKQARAYLDSKEFIDAYNQYRETKKPSPPEEPKSTSQLTDEYRENLRKSIAEMEKSKTNVPKDQQAMLDPVIDSMKQQLNAAAQDNKAMFPPEMDSQLRQVHAQQMEEYAKDLAAWEKAYPENNPKPMIKTWLTAFLEKSAGIDFDAKTIETKPGVRQFVDQEYERKDRQWKLFFRAGKETVAAARTFAQEWLAELNH